MQSRALSGGNPRDENNALLFALIIVNRGVALLRQAGNTWLTQ